MNELSLCRINESAPYIAPRTVWRFRLFDCGVATCLCSGLSVRATDTDWLYCFQFLHTLLKKLAAAMPLFLYILVGV